MPNSFLEDSLKIREEKLGKGHSLFAQSLNSLAELYYAQGDYVRARPLFEQALAIRKATLGEPTPTPPPA